MSRCDGSAKFTYGSTSVLAALTGPLEVRIRDEQLDQATLQISSLPLKGLASPNHKALAYSIKLILSALLDLRRHPRSLIQLTIQTLSAPSLKYSKPFKTFTEDEEDEPDRDDRSCVEYATAMNACMVACLDAGLDMKGLAVAVGVAFVKEKGLVVDPSLELESQAEVCFVLGYSFGQDVGGEQGELVWCETLGHGNQSDWDEKIVSEVDSSEALYSS